MDALDFGGVYSKLWHQRVPNKYISRKKIHGCDHIKLRDFLEIRLENSNP